jgi:hypothetical protein
MASFWDTLFGGGSERDAANNNRNQLNQYSTNATNTLNNNYSNSNNNSNRSATNASNYYDNSYGLYSNLLNSGNSNYDSALSNSLSALNRGRSNYDTLDSLASRYGSATNLLLDSLGANGNDGNTRATNSYQASPGYQWQLDQGQQALERSRNRRGMLNSGNTDIDTLTYSQGLANQDYGNWQDRLAGFRDGEVSATTNAATGRSNIDQATSNLYQNDASNRTNLASTVATGQSNANSGNATNQQWLANSLNNNNQYNTTNQLGVYGNTTSGNINANNLEAQGQSQGARNLLNLLTSGATSLATLGSGSFGGGSSGGGSTLSNLYSQYFGNGTGYETNPWSSGGRFGGR